MKLNQEFANTLASVSGANPTLIQAANTAPQYPYAAPGVPHQGYNSQIAMAYPEGKGKVLNIPILNGSAVVAVPLPGDPILPPMMPDPGAHHYMETKSDPDENASVMAAIVGKEEDTRYVLVGYFPQNPTIAHRSWIAVRMCKDCGSLVLSIDMHEVYHDRVDPQNIGAPLF